MVTTSSPRVVFKLQFQASNMKRQTILYQLSHIFLSSGYGKKTLSATLKYRRVWARFRGAGGPAPSITSGAFPNDATQQW